MSIELTEQQQRTLDTKAEIPPRVIDPRDNAAYYLVPALAWGVCRRYAPFAANSMLLAIARLRLRLFPHTTTSSPARRLSTASSKSMSRPRRTAPAAPVEAS